VRKEGFSKTFEGIVLNSERFGIFLNIFGGKKKFSRISHKKK